VRVVAYVREKVIVHVSDQLMMTLWSLSVVDLGVPVRTVLQ